MRGDKGNVAVLCRKLSAARRTTCVEQRRTRLHAVRLTESSFQFIVFAFVIKTFSLRPQAVENLYPLVREFKAITVLLHFESKKLHVRGIPPKDKVHSGATIRDEVDGSLRLGYEDRMVDCQMHRADDTDT